MEMQIVTETYKDMPRDGGDRAYRIITTALAVLSLQMVMNVISIREQDIGGNEIKMTFGSDPSLGLKRHIIYGASGDDIIVGGGGDDVVLGGTGEDVILGGDNLCSGDLDEDMMRDERDWNNVNPGNSS